MTHGVEKQPSTTFRVINYKENTLCQQIDKENFNECIPEVPVCVIHKGPDVKNSVSDCREFKLKPIKERRKILRYEGLRFRCCSGTHRKAYCTQGINCKDCGYHITSLHLDALPTSVRGREEALKEQHVTTINRKCTKAGKGFKINSM